MISIIVAVAENGVIGKSNSMPWHLPAEQANFKRITMGHPIIMGRKTHESIGRTLPGRDNIVITSDQTYSAAEGSTAVTSLDEAIFKAVDADEIFIIGGSTIYEQALPLADKIYLTKVRAKIDGDIFFKFDSADWKEISIEKHQANTNNPYDYDFVLLERKN